MLITPLSAKGTHQLDVASPRLGQLCDKVGPTVEDLQVLQALLGLSMACARGALARLLAGDHITKMITPSFPPYLQGLR